MRGSTVGQKPGLAIKQNERKGIHSKSCKRNHQTHLPNVVIFIVIIDNSESFKSRKGHFVCLAQITYSLFIGSN